MSHKQKHKEDLEERIEHLIFHIKANPEDNSPFACILKDRLKEYSDKYYKFTGTYYRTPTYK